MYWIVQQLYYYVEFLVLWGKCLIIILCIISYYNITNNSESSCCCTLIFYPSMHTVIGVFSMSPLSVNLRSTLNELNVNEGFLTYMLMCDVWNGTTLNFANNESIGDDGSMIEFSSIYPKGTRWEKGDAHAILSNVSSNHMRSIITVLLNISKYDSTTTICSSNDVSDSITVHSKYGFNLYIDE